MLEIYGDRARAIFNCCYKNSSDLRSWRFLRNARPCTCDGLLALIQLRHELQGYSTGVCFVASNAKRKEKREVLGTSSNEPNVT